MASSECILTDRDGNILTRLFDPEARPSNSIVDQDAYIDLHMPDPQSLEDITRKQKLIIMTVERIVHSDMTFIKKQRHFNSARSTLRDLQVQFQYPGLWNDMAQIIRLQFGNDLLISSSHSFQTVEAVLAAEEAISSLDIVESRLSPTLTCTQMSSAQARTLSSAFLQRGTLFNAAYKRMLEEPDAKPVLNRFLKWKGHDFQEAASEAFFNAGRLGSELGRALAIHINPTAKLCGQIVREAMRRELCSV